MKPDEDDATETDKATAVPRATPVGTAASPHAHHLLQPSITDLRHLTPFSLPRGKRDREGEHEGGGGRRGKRWRRRTEVEERLEMEEEVVGKEGMEGEEEGGENGR